MAQRRPRPCLPWPPGRVRKSRRALRDTEFADLRFSAKDYEFELQFPGSITTQGPQVVLGAWVASAPCAQNPKGVVVRIPFPALRAAPFLRAVRKPCGLILRTITGGKGLISESNWV